MFTLLLLVLFNLSFANLEEALKKELYKRFGDEVKLVKFKALGPVGNVEDISLDVEYGRFKSLAYVLSEGKEVKVILDLLWKVKVYKAKHDIPKGSALDPSMFEEEYIWTRSIPSDLKISPEDFSNYVAGTTILKGNYLRRVYLKPVPVVKYGDTLECVYREEKILITFNCKALETGSLGKIIRVKKEQSDKVLRAKVLSRRKAEILQ